MGQISMPSKGIDLRDNARVMNALQRYIRYIIDNTRLGIPVMAHEEALHGHAAPGASIFPQALALGSTWEPELIEKVFSAAAKEVRVRGGHQVLTPVLDIAREPRFGRIEEMYGEDPYLVSRMVRSVSILEGIQKKLGGKAEVKYSLGCKIVEQELSDRHLVNVAGDEITGAHSGPDG
jgi:beta-glucosidase